jgi:hypothetical protein
MRSIDRREANFFTSLSKKYNLPAYIIEQICKYPFGYAKQCITDRYDSKDILFGGLMRLKLKPAFQNKKNVSFVKTSIAHRVKNSRKFLDEIQPEYLNRQLKNKIMKPALITEFEHPLQVGDEFMTDFCDTIFTVKAVRESAKLSTLYSYTVDDGELILDVDVVGKVLRENESEEQ